MFKKIVLCALARPVNGVHTITQTIPCETTEKDAAGMQTCLPIKSPFRKLGPQNTEGHALRNSAYSL